MWLNAFIALVLSMIPVSGDFKMHLSLLLTALVANQTAIRYGKRLFNLRKKQHIFIRSLEGRGWGRVNPIYEHFQKYIATKLTGQLTYEVVSRDGDTKLVPYDTFAPVTDVYNKHRITIIVSKHKDSGSGWSSQEETIYTIQSNTASREEIEEYINQVMDTKFSINQIDIYQPDIEKKKDDGEAACWKRQSVVTNKTLKNTFYSTDILQTLFDDVAKFAASGDEYVSKGIPYKRGYMLHGPPGSGKTCVSKILAKMYNIPIFYLDLTTIDSNSALIDLVNDISLYTSNKKYILLMEDVERSSFFAETESKDKTSKVTMDCLLNILDGVVEPHNRITIMTVNDEKQLEKHPALIRPGRIDKIIRIGYCTPSQIYNMIKLFFPKTKVKEKRITSAIKKEITPATVMKFLQEVDSVGDMISRLSEY